MVVFYTHDFRGEKGESHRLLLNAARCYHEMGFGGSVDGINENDIVTGDMGKPEIPGWNDFSISHTAAVGDAVGTWAVAVHDDECGLDVQVHRDADCMKLAERWFHEEELQLIRESGPEEFFRIWARREALVKSVGTTIVNSHLPSTAGDTAEFENRVWQLKDIIIPDADNMAAAVCAEKIGEIRIVELGR